MALVFVLVFIGVFLVIAVPAIAFGSAQSSKRVLASLDSALATEAPSMREQIVNLRKDSSFSSIPWLNRRMLNLQLAPYLQRVLSQANVKWSAGRLMAICAVCFAVPAYGVYMQFGTGLIALGVGVAVGMLPFLWILFLRKQRFGKFEEGLPEAIDLMVSALRAGHSLVAAMGLVARESPAPVGPEFKACFEEQNYGLEMKTALENMQVRIPLQDLKIVATAIMIQKESGGNLAEVLDKTSHVIRERFRLKRQVRTHTAQGRMTGWVLTFLPLTVGVLIYIVNPELMSVLWHKQLGIKLIWGAVGLTFLGGLVIRQIVNLDI